MTTIPANPVTQEDLTEWYRLQDLLATTKVSEMLLRQKIYKGLFLAPVEGTNTIPLGTEGWVVKAKRVISRDFDKVALQENLKIDPETKTDQFAKNGIDSRTLIVWKPELALKAYRALTDEQKAIFNEVLVIKDGSPALEIVKPARAPAA